MTDGYEIISVDSDNIARTGFFCYMSKPKSPGYHQKREWLKARFAEGMKLKILHEHGYRDVGFIEYLPENMPGEPYRRRVPGHHCLWVVGKGKGKGYGTRLLQECLEDAQAQNKSGVVMVTSDSVCWPQEIFLRNGFEEVDQAPPSFRLLVHRFGSAPEPAFPHDWEARLQRFGPGLTVIRTPQCPFTENGTHEVVQTAQQRGIPAQVVELKSAREVQETSPSAFGVFGIVLNGRLLSYYYLPHNDLEKRLDQMA